MDEQQSQNEQPTESALVRTPPYVSFKSFLTLMEDMKANGVPPQVDRSVLSRFSGGLGSQLLMGLKSLGLVDDDRKPTARGVTLIRSFGEDSFKNNLKHVIASSYPFLNTLDLMEATPSMFAAAFKNGTGAKEDVLRKCRTFYLHAAQYAGIPLGTRILNGSVPRSPSTGATKRKAKSGREKSGDDPSEHGGAGQTGQAASGTDTIAGKLLDKFPPFDPAWPDDIKAKWFEGYGRLLTMGEK